MSNIDPTVPLYGLPTTASVRSNFAIAKSEIEALLPLSGGTLTGALILAGDPTLARAAATKNYVDNAVAGGSGGTGGIPEAPSDGNTYGRSNAAWTSVLPLAGGALHGLLTLSGPPASALHAATKAYVDGFLPLTGGTMTGDLYLNRNAQPGAPQIADGFCLNAGDGGNIIFQGNTFGYAQTYFLGIPYGGTNAARTATPSGYVGPRISLGGYDGTRVLLNIAAIDLATDEQWSPTATGSRIDFYTTRHGTTTVINNMRLAHDGGLLLPYSAASMGNGTVNAAGGYYVNGTNIFTRAENSYSGAPSGTSSTTYVMLGINLTFTPLMSTRALLFASGNTASTSTGNGTWYNQLRIGTGTPPAWGAPNTGISVGGPGAAANIPAYFICPWSCIGFATNLVPGTTYWVDVAQYSLQGTTSNFNFQVYAIEF